MSDLDTARRFYPAVPGPTGRAITPSNVHRRCAAGWLPCPSEPAVHGLAGCSSLSPATPTSACHVRAPNARGHRVSPPTRSLGGRAMQPPAFGDQRPRSNGSCPVAAASLAAQEFGLISRIIQAFLSQAANNTYFARGLCCARLRPNRIRQSHLVGTVNLYQ